MTDPLATFAQATREWFRSALGAPTPVQAQAWEAIARGRNALVIAPTGSGKTLAAFLHAIDRLTARADGQAKPAAASRAKSQSGTRVLYISPMKALAADVRKNLERPLGGIDEARRAAGLDPVAVSTGMRSGDTPSAERARLIRKPPDILVTTPESLYLMLTSRAADTLTSVDTVIIDEVHSVAGTKRGAHLALSLERLDGLLEAPALRIGLSATVRPADTVAEFLGGPHPVTIVQPPAAKVPDLRIEVPVDDLGDIAATSSRGPAGGVAEGTGSASREERTGSIWPHIEDSVLDHVLDHRSTIVFVNSRGLCERLTARLNELYAERRNAPWPEVLHSATGPTTGRRDLDDSESVRAAEKHEGDGSGEPPEVIAMSHHGSVSKEQRLLVEARLKAGELRCVVATSSLELGIDMGDVDLVIQVAAPPDVAAGLQRVGRANHQVDGTAAGIVYPRTRRDLLDATVVVQRMEHGEIEALAPPRNPLDVLAQHTVAAVVAAQNNAVQNNAVQNRATDDEPLTADAWFSTVTRAHPFRELTRPSFDSVLGMLAGRWSSDELATFRPAIVWDRKTGALTPRPGARQLATVNAGTIPDRGAYSVVLPEGAEEPGARRVGELDEEMVHESRVGDVITLGAGSWRITEIGTDRVVVVPAPGRSARLPFWHGDGPGRPAELGRAIGAFTREFQERTDADTGAEAAAGDAGTEPAAAQAAAWDARVAANLHGYFSEQSELTGQVPNDLDLLIEVCPDEVGDLRVMLHSPYGRRVHAPWALALTERFAQRFGSDATVIAADDGIVARIPGVAGAEAVTSDLFLFDPELLTSRVERLVGGSALFASRFRECASRSLLLPRRTPGKRTPLWQQRLRAGQLLEAVAGFPDFPILIETARECLQDVYDLPALRALMAELDTGRIRLSVVETAVPSPFAGDLLFGYVGELLYEGDRPLAERRASALALDPSMLAELIGGGDPARLLDPEILEQVESELQHTAPDRRVRGAEGVADLLRRLGPLTVEQVAERLVDPDGSGETEPVAAADAALAELARAGRAVELVGPGPDASSRWAAVEDAGALRAVLGDSIFANSAFAHPLGAIPAEFLESPADPVRGLLVRFAATHTVFTAERAAASLGVGPAVLRAELDALTGEDTLVALGGSWIHRAVFTRVRDRGLRAARAAVRPVSGAAYARLLGERQSATRPRSGHDGLLRVIEQLAGLALPADAWESTILPARVSDFSPRLLDELIASGEVLWAPAESSGAAPDSAQVPRVALVPAELAGELLPIGGSDDGGNRRDPAARLDAAILEALAGGGAWTAGELAAKVRAANVGAEEDAAGDGPSADAFVASLWRLAGRGLVRSDTFAAVRGAIAAAHPRPAARGRQAAQRPRLSRRAGRSAGRARFGSSYRSLPPAPRRVAPGTGPGSGSGSGSESGAGRDLGLARSPRAAGRWSLGHIEPTDPTERVLGMVESMLDRYGIITRSAAIAEGVPGGFPALRPVLRALEDSGDLVRGRFVEGLGAAQFAEPATVDRLRDLDREGGPGRSGTYTAPHITALSAADPANPYGQALAWPDTATPSDTPKRTPGAIIVLAQGAPAAWLARGGKSLLTFPLSKDALSKDALPKDAASQSGADFPADPESICAALVAAAHRLGAGGFVLETIDGSPAASHVWSDALQAAGFRIAPRGLRLYPG